MVGIDLPQRGVQISDLSIPLPTEYDDADNIDLKLSKALESRGQGWDLESEMAIALDYCSGGD